MRVMATKTVEYEIRLSKQENRDHDYGTRPGWYAWVGPPGEGSDFVVGPHKTGRAARVAACEQLRRIGYELVEKA